MVGIAGRSLELLCQELDALAGLERLGVEFLELRYELAKLSGEAASRLANVAGGTLERDPEALR